MLLLIQLGTTLAITALCVLILGPSRHAVLRGFLLGVLVNIAVLLGTVFIKGRVGMYGAPMSGSFVTTLIVVTVLIGLVAAVVMGFAYGRLRLVCKSDRWRWWNVLFVLLGAVLGFAIGLSFFVPHWFHQTLGDIPADHFLFLLTQGNGESTDAQDLEILNLMIAPVIACAVIGACAGFIRSDLEIWRKEKTSVRFRHVRAAVVIAMCMTLVGTVTYAFRAVPLAGVAKQTFETSNYVEQNYVAPTDQNVTMPSKKRNLVHIYMESVENSYYSKDLGGYMDQNLMPELAKLSDIGVSFSHNDKHGGPQQIYASGHSVAAMVNMGAGIPMLFSGAGDGSQMSYPNFRTIGDILKDAGYNNEYMVGNDATWGGLGDYYRRHGDFTVFDLNEAKKRKLIPQDYKVWWGFEDDKLYDYAKTELTSLAEDSKPFYMVIENADTHFPDGFVSPKMTDAPFESQYANVIHYSQAETVKLIQWIQAQPWGANTTIVVTGDHKSMDQNFFDGWDENYDRTVVNFILNPVQGTNVPASITHNRQYAPFDLFPTILSSIGVTIKDGRLGMGTDLFTGQKTLMERDGFAALNEELSVGSPFYDRHRETQAENPDVNQDRK